MISIDEMYIRQAKLVAMRATCARRQVGCVLVDSQGHVLATGRNGPPSKVVHCTDVPCGGAESASGTNLESCQAVHAEQNALLQCKDVGSIHTAYVTTSPCTTCVKLLMNTGCQRIVFAEKYAHDDKSRALWMSTHAIRAWDLHVSAAIVPVAN